MNVNFSPFCHLVPVPHPLSCQVTDVSPTSSMSLQPPSLQRHCPVFNQDRTLPLTRPINSTLSPFVIRVIYQKMKSRHPVSLLKCFDVSPLLFESRPNVMTLFVRPSGIRIHCPPSSSLVCHYLASSQIRSPTK